MSEYTIGFQHTSQMTASSKIEAMETVRREARIVLRSVNAQLSTVEADDGLYCYAGRTLGGAIAERQDDQTGARAFAVISLV